MNRFLTAFSLLTVSSVTAADQGGTLASLTEAKFSGARYAGYVTDQGVSEASGMTFSRVESDRLWLLNDSGNAPSLHAMTASGEAIAQLTIEGIENRDWEDLASVELDGSALLVIGDVGDNGGVRESVIVHFVAEPADLHSIDSVEPLWSLEIRYPEGPRDCESIAVDAENGFLYLLSKRDRPARLYRVPLQPSTKTVTAEFVTELRIPQPSADILKKFPRTGQYSSQPTAMDFDDANRQAAVLTYHHAYIFERADGESWGQAFSRQPQLLRLPLLPQGEALAYSAAENSLYITSEKWPSPIIRLERR